MLEPLSRWTVLRPPDPARSDLERDLAAANAAAAADARALLGAALPWFDVHALGQSVDGTTAQYAPDGAPAAARAEVDALLDALGGDDAPGATIEAALDGGAVVQQEGPVTDLPPATRAIASALARSLAAIVRSRVRVSATAAISAVEDLVDEDALAFQLRGARNVTLRQPMVLSPHPDAPDPGPTHLHGTLALESGSGIFVPRGWEAAPMLRDELSVALELRIRRQSLLDVVDGMARHARGHPAARADVPVDLGAPVRSYGGSVFEGEDLAAGLRAELTSSERQQQEVFAWRARLVPAHRGQRSAALALLGADDFGPTGPVGAIELVSDLPGGWWCADDGADPDAAIRLVAGGWIVSSSSVPEALAVVGALAGGRSVAIADLAQVAPEDDVRSLVQDLLRAGLVAATSPASEAA